MGVFAPLPETTLSIHRAAFANRAASAALVAAALSVAAAAHAEVNFSIGVGGPVYEQPAPVYVNPPPVYYQPPPPVYYQPAPPVYYQPAPPAYYQPAPPPHYRQAQPYYPAERPRLSDMQQRALDNCSLLAPREQGRCRATVLSTTR
jgi:hypothetical protein